jgi:hypothetical protein
MNLLKMFLGVNFFKVKANEYKRNATAGIKRGTVGRVQANMQDKMLAVDKKVLGAQNKAIDKTLGGRGKKGGGGGNSGGEGGGGQQQQQKGGGQGKKNPNMGNSPKPQPGRKPGGRPPQGGRMPQQQQQMSGGGRAPMPGSRAAMAQAGNNAVGRPGPGPGPGPQTQNLAGGFVNYGGGGGGGAGGGGEERTQAIDIRGLEQEAQKQVVGWIVAQSGNHKGQDFRLYDGKNVVGTAANCDIVVTDPYLSARHCTIRYDNGNFVVIDLDSRNGTYVNQKKISKEDLIDNDTVRLGKSEFKFKALF